MTLFTYLLSGFQALVARLSAAAAGEADAELAGAIGAKLVAVAAVCLCVACHHSLLPRVGRG